jgi:arylsulfatase
VLEAAGLPEPVFVNGVQQMPLHGVSMAYSFDDAAAGERHETQYFEMFVNRGIYHKGWTAVTRHSTPWAFGELPAFDDDVWELYGPGDWTQAHDLAAEQPGKLRELQRLFLIEAVRYNVLPLDDRRIERFNAELAGRPQLIRGKSQLLFGGMGRLTENSVVVLKNKSHAVSAQIVVPDGGANGVIVAQGGAFGGWSLYLHEGKPAYCYNLFGLHRFKVYGQEPVAAGEHQIRMEFGYDGGGLAKGGSVVALRRRGQGRRGAGRCDAAHDLLGRRDHRCGDRRRDTRQRRLRPQRQPVHRPHQVGPARHRRGRRRPRPPDHTRGAAADRDGPAVNNLPISRDPGRPPSSPLRLPGPVPGQPWRRDGPGPVATGVRAHHPAPPGDRRDRARYQPVRPGDSRCVIRSVSPLTR